MLLSPGPLRVPDVPEEGGVCVCVCNYACVCVYATMRVCMCARVCACCVGVCVHVSVYALCVYATMRACMCARMCACCVCQYVYVRCVRMRAVCDVSDPVPE